MSPAFRCCTNRKTLGHAEHYSGSLDGELIGTVQSKLASFKEVNVPIAERPSQTPESGKGSPGSKSREAR